MRQSVSINSGSEALRVQLYVVIDVVDSGARSKALYKMYLIVSARNTNTNTRPLEYVTTQLIIIIYKQYAVRKPIHKLNNYEILGV